MSVCLLHCISTFVVNERHYHTDSLPAQDHEKEMSAAQLTL